MKTILFVYKIEKVLIFCFFFVSCEREDIKSGLPSNGGEVEVVFNLITQKMEEVVPVESSPMRSSDDEVLDVSFFNSNEVPFTRAANSLTPTEEAAVKNISYFEFNGTAGTSTCVKKGTATLNTTNNKVSLTLTTSTTIRTVYIIANLGDITGSVGDNVTLDNFKNLTYAFANDANVATTGLPMAGFTNTTAGLNGGTINLQRLVAKVRFICNVNVPQGESFTFNSMRLVNAAKLGAYATKASYPPNSNTTNFTSYAAVNSRDQVWYVPENRRGTVTNTDPKKKSALAPAYSTHVEITGVYVKGGVTYENTYRIYLGTNATNNFEVLGNRIYQIQATIKGFDALDERIYVIENLSSKGTANSYIALRKNSGYKFNAKVMGNGVTTTAFTATFTLGATPYTQKAPAIVPKTLSPTKVILIWETGTSAGQVIKPGSLSLSNGIVRFDTSDSDIEGNAVIGVTDNANNVLWSWHIWKTTYNPDVSSDIHINRSGRQFVLMKCNLGAVASSYNWSQATPTAGQLGLLYQWGRKDPFLSGNGWAGTTQPYPTVAHSSHTWRIDGAAIPNTGPAGEPLVNAESTIAYTIKHPTHFILGSIGVNDWVKALNYSEQRDNLWGNPNSGTAPNTNDGAKSIYDPCPLGWRVPLQATWTRFTLSGNQEDNEAYYNVSSPFDKGWTFYLTGDKTGPVSYYPSLGIVKVDTGSLVGVGGEGNCWSSSTYGSTSPISTGQLNYYGNLMIPVRSCSRGYAMGVRCAKE